LEHAEETNVLLKLEKSVSQRQFFQVYDIKKADLQRQHVTGKSKTDVKEQVICSVDLGINTDAVCSIMRADGREKILAYGMAFYKKRCMVKVQEI
jgi:hypothetical protein